MGSTSASQNQKHTRKGKKRKREMPLTGEESEEPGNGIEIFRELCPNEGSANFGRHVHEEFAKQGKVKLKCRVVGRCKERRDL
jgi:hypothetical protein